MTNKINNCITTAFRCDNCGTGTDGGICSVCGCEYSVSVASFDFDKATENGFAFKETDSEFDYTTFTCTKTGKKVKTHNLGWGDEINA